MMRTPPVWPSVGAGATGPVARLWARAGSLKPAAARTSVAPRIIRNMTASRSLAAPFLAARPHHEEGSLRRFGEPVQAGVGEQQEGRRRTETTPAQSVWEDTLV